MKEQFAAQKIVVKKHGKLGFWNDCILRLILLYDYAYYFNENFNFNY